MRRAINQISFMTPWRKPADDWSRAKAAEMHQAGYSAGTIIDHLEAYGVACMLPSTLYGSFKREAIYPAANALSETRAAGFGAGAFRLNHPRHELPVFLRSVSRHRLRLPGGVRQVEHRGVAVIVEQPGIDQKPVFRDGEIVTAFHFPNPRRGVILMPIAAYLAAEV